MDSISAQVEVERAQLARSLDALTETVNPDRISNEVTTAATDIGGKLAQQAWGTLRAQPAGGLLVAVGLGLLAAGSQRQSRQTPAPTPTAVDLDTALAGFDDRIASADAAMKAELTGQMEPHPDASASQLKAALNKGLGHLSPDARKRVLDARRAVISAQETVERKARRTARKTERFAQEQPLTVGAIALGIGVLVGTLLPSTRREDEILGAKRDALMAEARNTLEDEMLKAKSQAEAALQRKTG
jgi:ElaB/YqjD/DUF883 family membrane-anchored ribosome-binding protein